MKIKMQKNNAKRCAMCKYWNGAIGSTTIVSTNFGVSFEFEADEKHICFNPRKHC